MRVALVGCGSIGRIHALAISEAKPAWLCGCADIRPERARAYAAEYGDGRAAGYDTMEALLEKENPDVVHICTPHFCHVPMAVTVLKQNRSVFLEKPPAISRQEFSRLKQAAEKSRGRIGICFQNRYNEAVQKVSGLLADGRLGSVRGGRVFVTWNRSASYYRESDWRGRLASEGGGALMNQSIHALDLLLGWMGRPLTVSASMQNHRLKNQIEVEDTLEAYLTFSSGEEPVRACFYSSNAYVADAPALIELVCEQGFVRMEGSRVWYQTKELRQPVLWTESQTVMPGKAYWGNGHSACIKDFYDCLSENRPFQNDLASVENTFQTVMDIYDCASGLAADKR